jgi:ABC-type polysaccharide/polyol phosphate transport system ATPase subunit
MAEQPLVKVSGLSKKYCRSLRRSLWYGVKDMASEMTARKSDAESLRTQEFWAVRDLNFELRRGETLGLIGRNGAGKTTLLRLMNSLIKPTSGHVEVRGRVQALIALGVGFSPILTGRENIFVAASVLGLTKRQTERQFDSIVEFADLADFIDTPVQNYSAGMQVRLGFSIAAHMEPEVLLVDEVLAVGDATFRRKAIEKMRALLDRATVIFVSHNMNHIEQICERGLYLREGQPAFHGTVNEAIAMYMDDTNKYAIDEARRTFGGSGREGSGEIQFTGLRLTVNGKRTDTLWAGGSLVVEAPFVVKKEFKTPVWFIVQIEDLATGVSLLTNGFETEVDQEAGIAKICFPNLTLRPRSYAINLVITEPALTVDRVNGAAFLNVLDRPDRNDHFTYGYKHDLLHWEGECSIEDATVEEALAIGAEVDTIEAAN